MMNARAMMREGFLTKTEEARKRGSFKKANPRSMVSTQRTKTRVLTRGCGRDHLANLHIGVGDDDTVNEELDELPSLLPGGLLEAALHSGAEGFDRLHDPGHIVLPLGFCRELIFLARQHLKALLQPWRRR
jgi:hypothetical protein